MKSLLLSAFVLASSSASALGFVDCHSILMGGRDSSFIQVTDAKGNFDPKKLAQDLLNKFCPKNNEKVMTVACKRFVATDEQTQVCYLTTTSGYMYMTKDYMENVNIIISRWD